MVGVEVQIKYLLDNQLIERISNKKLNINGKGRLYNQDKPPSKILTKAVGSLYKKQFPQESKPKRRIRNVKDKPAGSADVLLKYDEPTVKEGLRIVNQDKFKNFTEDYDTSQSIKTDSLNVELKFRITTQKQTLVKDSDRLRNPKSFYDDLTFLPDTYDNDGVLARFAKGKVEISEVFINQETIYGGLQGLKLYIKYLI